MGILPTLRQNKLYFPVLPFFIFAGFVSLLAYTRKNKPDLIHAHWIIPQGFLVYLFSKFYKRPYIVTAHGADAFGLKQPFFPKLRSLVLRNADTVTTVSNALKAEIIDRKEGGDEIIVLTRGVGSDCFKAHLETCNRSGGESDRDLNKVLYVGRLTEKKGVSYLIRAIPIVKKLYPDIHLTIVGGGELAVELRADTIALGLLISALLFMVLCLIIRCQLICGGRQLLVSEFLFFIK
ncbi:MAG: glycosyltransferase involved in cell wall biosynthesis [Desulforhopalus sp.]|jgi:glycosyltransferase involved in cell wall biosynthesis